MLTQSNELECVHRIIIGDSRNIPMIGGSSVDLVVTSPPYPMIQMWDGLFLRLMGLNSDDPLIEDSNKFFQSCHNVLGYVWTEMGRVLKPGGIICVNIGDAVRTLDEVFKLWPNHSMITMKFMSIGYDILPSIIWSMVIASE